MTGNINLKLQSNGKLSIIRDGEAAVFDFNEFYKGYYPSCRWTSSGRGDLLFLAGTDGSGVPHLFSSAEGETWTEHNIRTRLGLPDPEAYGDIIKILYENENRQIFLATKNGYLVTLPDCPKCVRARRVSNLALADAALEDGHVLLRDTAGKEMRIPVGIASQYRCAWTFAKPFLRNGGLMLDLREGADRQALPIPAAIPLDIGELDGLLGRMPKMRPLFFFCSHGYLADQAVRDARAAGFERSYSLGSIMDMLEDQA